MKGQIWNQSWGQNGVCFSVYYKWGYEFVLMADKKLGDLIYMSPGCSQTVTVMNSTTSRPWNVISLCCRTVIVTCTVTLWSPWHYMYLLLLQDWKCIYWIFDVCVSSKVSRGFEAVSFPARLIEQQYSPVVRHHLAARGTHSCILRVRHWI